MHTESSRRPALIVWWVLAAGVLVLTVVAATVGPGFWSRSAHAGNVLAWIVLGMTPAFLLASRFLPSRIQATPGATVESIALSRTILALALNASIGLYAALTWMLSGNSVAIVALAISLAGLLLALPSQRRWEKLCRVVAATSGPDLASGANVTPARPPLSRKRKLVGGGLLLGALALSAAALVLMGNLFWTEEVLRRPASPITRILLFAILASLMAGFAALRLVEASASRHPRRQRAYGILLLFFAGWLVVLALRGG